MNWIVFLFALELGVTPMNGWWLYEKPPVLIGQSDTLTYYTDLAAEIWIADLFFIGGNVRSDVRPHGLTSWQPFWMTFGFNAGIRVGILELGWRHLCTHPLQTYAQLRPKNNPILEGAYEEIYLRIGELGR